MVRLGLNLHFVSDFFSGRLTDALVILKFPRSCCFRGITCASIFVYQAMRPSGAVSQRFSRILSSTIRPLVAAITRSLMSELLYSTLEPLTVTPTASSRAVRRALFRATALASAGVVSSPRYAVPSETTTKV
jgi:hypothetical protein